MPFIRAGATVFDVGANKGEWSRAVHEQVGDVRLFLFEPQEACLPYLKIHGAVPTLAAVGEADGRAPLYSPGDTAPNASQRWLRLFEQPSPFYKWISAGFQSSV
jgi:FkbM family methyltransferase